LRLALVASHNGFGHTIRMLRLHRGLIDFGVESTLIAGSLQLEAIGALDEERVFGLNELENSWIDGPHVKTSRVDRLSEASKEVLKKIACADTVLSDNVTWPLEVNENTHVYSHFLWADFYKNMQSLVNLDCELERVSKLRSMLSPSGFAMHSQVFPSQKRFLIRLPRLGEYSELADSPRSDEIWIINGKTGANSANWSGDDLIGRVSARKPSDLLTSKRPPKLFVGRPGMGSIGEALSAKIPFFPLYSGEDWALEGNTLNLGLLGVSPERRFEGNVSDLLFSDLSRLDENLQSFFQEFMSDEASWVSAILSSVSRA